MNLNLEDFWNKRVYITYGNGQSRQGILNKNKSCIENGFLTITNMTLFDEFRILLNSIDGIGLFEESQQ